MLTQQDVNGILATHQSAPATVYEKDVLDSVAEVTIFKKPTVVCLRSVTN